jgi:tRNA modification GTPase
MSKTPLQRSLHPPGEGGIAIVRISGPDSLRIADEVFRCAGSKPSERPSHVIVHGHVYDEVGEVIDEALLLIMRAPRSYTCEDVVEIHGHGGGVPARRILRRVLNAGARLAQPGEFTKRAFLNGRLDLVQAEAVLDLIKSKTERAACAAADQLCGNTSRLLTSCYERIVALLADVEAALDFPEDETPRMDYFELESRIKNEINILCNVMSSSAEGKLIRDGVRIAITGKPNVGKSTLFNALVGSERAIVSRHPGTTRDIVEDWISIEGIPCSVVDTAGIRDSECEIEQEGVRRARERLSKSDIRIHVFDLSSDFDRHDQEQIENIQAGKSIIVLNKADLTKRMDTSILPAGVPTVTTALAKGEGVEDVKSAVIQLLGVCKESDHAHIAISERHRALIERCCTELENALQLLQQQVNESTDIIAHHIRQAMISISEVLGKSYTEDMLDSIFSRFCIGK